MSITPVFDQTVAASSPDLHKASNIFPQPSTHWSFAADRLGPWKGPWPPVETRVIPNPKPEPKWRTFLRCLLWWLP